MNKSIQIVAFDNPYPPDYGGVIDVYYKIEALHALGVKVNLHLFNYGKRNTIEPLNKICESVFQYDRNMGLGALVSSTPFIVKSRENNKLLNNLSKNPAPILFEGLHCCSFLSHSLLKNHIKMVRTHNVEHDYYKGLYKNTSNLLKKFYYNSESKKLKAFEPILANADLIFSLSQQDAAYFQKYQKTEWVPPFHSSYPQVMETGDYILFHGNLGVEENINALSALIKNVFMEVKHKIVVAGKSPPQKIITEIGKNKAIKLVSNPSEEEMSHLISRAKCHILYTNQNTGVKLKLVHAIQTNGHIVLNDAMLFDNSFKDELEVANDWKTMAETLNKCMENGTVKPRPKLTALFNNTKNAEKIVSFLP